MMHHHLLDHWLRSCPEAAAIVCAVSCTHVDLVILTIRTGGGKQIPR